jgi:thiamine-phosphate pyrophosphorylase
MPRLPDTDIYAITDSALSRGRSVLDVTEHLLRSGVRIIQYREKDKKAGEMLKECRQIREATKRAGACFIVNDYVDIAILAGADGVHVGQDDLPVGEIRRLLGPDRIIGLSTHSPQQAAQAVAAKADYIGVGPLFATQTKKDVCEPVGLSYLDYIVNNITIPFVAIGGIKRHNIAAVVRHGASCCCLVSEILEAEDIEQRIGEIRMCMKESAPL